MKYCVIDVGSNSVRLMTWADGTTLYKKVCTTRLGEGIAQEPVLREGAMERTACAVAQFSREAEAEGAPLYAFATAAVRTAKNGGEFCARVKNLCGVELDVVSGEEEAELALLGALGKADGSVIDIGGASTEISRRRGGKRDLSVSLNIGAVRLFDRCADDEKRLYAAIEGEISPLAGVKLSPKTYSVGGTVCTLAALMQGLEPYDAARINDFPMTAEAVKGLARRLLRLSPAERRGLRGMDLPRADIIAGGALLLSMLMEKLGLSVVYASDRDNLEGYLTKKIL